MTDNDWGFYCDIESEEVISQQEEKQEKQKQEKVKPRLKQQQPPQPSCIREATQHVVAICVMATVILFM